METKGSKRRIILGVAVALTLLWGRAGPARATPITFHFMGTVTQVNLDLEDPFGGTIGFGTIVHGHYTFESTTGDVVPDSNTGVYLMSGAPLGAMVTIGGNAFKTTDFLAIGLADNFPFTLDQYMVLAQAASGELTLELFLEDPTGMALGSDALLLTPPSLDRFATRDFHLIAQVDGNQVQIDGQLDSLSGGRHPGGAPVPEAGTLLLLGSSLAGWAIRRWVVGHAVPIRTPNP